MLGFLIGTCAIMILSGMHTIPEGSVGIYYQFGRLQPNITEPGLHVKWMWPITSVSHVDVRPQVDEITDIYCVSSDKLSITFPKVRVFNQLKQQDVYRIITEFGEMYDKYLIIEQVGVKVVEMCTSYTAEELYTKRFSTLNEEIFEHLQQIQKVHNSSLMITHVSVDKLILPKDVMTNYERVGAEKAKTDAEVQAQKRKLMEQETAHKLEQLDSEKQLKIKRLEADTEAYIAEKITESKVDQITRIAKANEQQFTPEYIQLQAIQTWGSIQKVIYFGNEIPHSLIMTNITGF